MANMSYCRFENTFKDVLDCLEHINDELEGTEKSARDRLIEVCRSISEEAE